MLATIKEPDGTSLSYCAAVGGTIDAEFITNACPTSLPQNAYAAPTQPVPTSSSTSTSAGSTATSPPTSADGGSNAFRDAQITISVVGATGFLIASSFFV
ncbi:hypothetical protein BT69DRAFT_1276511 [Atractiella rhizophila]|nr:hypothetical protein BT69DRAFT_1276511 [Atractiella rhizophila]